MGFCGPSGRWLNWLIPDSPFYIVKFGWCCKLHDQAYEKSGNKTRRTIDIEYLTCLLKQSDSFKLPRRYTARVLAGIYYTRVMLYGGKAWRRARARDSESSKKSK